jgi:hypothetical protein
VDKYFAYAAELLKTIPPHITDEPIIVQLKEIGFEPGKLTFRSSTRLSDSKLAAVFVLVFGIGHRRTASGRSEAGAP